MMLINLTPHPINLYDATGVREIQASGQLARVRCNAATVAVLEGLPVQVPQYSEIVGLPEPKEGTAYIVSSLVISALQAAGITRPDVVAPATGPQDGCIRCPESSRVLGITRFNTAGTLQ